MLDVTHLNFDYADQPLLKNVHFSLAAGKLLHIQGENGSGKTTLIKLLAGLLRPIHGDICYQGVSIEKQRVHYAQSMRYLGHKTGVYASLTPREYWFLGLTHALSIEHFDAAVQQLSLQGLEDVPCGLLSAGQRRRVALLRLVASDALLWLLDEPWVALDSHAVTVLKRMIEQHLAHGGQVVLTSHQMIPFDVACYQVYALCH